MLVNEFVIQKLQRSAWHSQKFPCFIQHRHCSSGQILEGTGSYCMSDIDFSEALVEQNLHNITRWYTIFSYQVSNERDNHGWVQKKISNNGTPRWPEKAVLGEFVINREQKEYRNILSQKGKSCPLSPPLSESKEGDRPRCPRAAGVPVRTNPKF